MTIKKLRLPPIKHKPKLNNNLVKLSQIYLKISNHSNKIYNQETALFKIDKLSIGE